MPLLEVNNLSLSFKSSLRSPFSLKTKMALHDVSFSLDGGEAFGVIGESGGGKTSLARCIAGLLMPASGTIDFDGVNVYPHVANRSMFRAQIQLVFQAYSASLDPYLTIERIILEGISEDGEKNGSGLPQKTAAELCKLVGLPVEILETFPSQLSGGQRQRVAIARALATHPRLLILDEPTSALDVLTQSQILHLIKNIKNAYGLSLIMISHDIANARYLCDRLAVVYHGSIVEMGETKKILAHPSHPYTRHLLSMSIV
ncbi:MAG TPA: ABC transporter ATP-binding protein [Bacteroidota bacterium]|nr:ABC transporter ATP-binding protein [Bacteroidota bacterium]